MCTLCAAEVRSGDRIKISEVNYCREDSDSKHQHQPFYSVSREETREMQNQYGNGDQIEQNRQYHLVFLSLLCQL